MKFDFSDTKFQIGIIILTVLVIAGYIYIY